jgi:hypothetical protein
MIVTNINQNISFIVSGKTGSNVLNEPSQYFKNSWPDVIQLLYKKQAVHKSNNGRKKVFSTLLV